MNNARKDLLENGYTIRKAVLPAYKLQGIKELALTHQELGGGIHKHHGMRQPHAFGKAPFITDILDDQNLTQFISDCLGSDKWYITNHADLHVNALSGWHKDDGMSYGDGGYFDGPAYQLKDPNVFKVAIYLQDHIDFDDGLTILPKSHRTEVINDGSTKQLHLTTQLGDAVIFDPRLSHTGQLNPIPCALSTAGKEQLQNLKAAIDEIEVTTNSKEEKTKLLLDLFRENVGTRSTIFFTVAVESPESNTFAINNMERQLNELEQGTSAFLPLAVHDKLKHLGIGLVDEKAFWKEHFSLNN